MTTKPLGGGAWYTYTSEWLAPGDRRAPQAALTEQIQWEQRAIRMFGKELMQPRLVGWAGALPYRYSGQVLEPRAAPPILDALTERVIDEVGVPFNHVLLNRYRDGDDRMGRHADDEPELGREPVIAAVSLGARRRFRMEKKGSRTRRTQNLADGSLLVMGGTMQHRWYHAVLKEPGSAEERINVTFRLLRGPPGWRAPREDRRRG